MRFYNNEINLNTYLEYFSIKSINHKIILNKKNPLINNIISDNYYVNFEDFKVENNKIKVKYYLEFKILYSSFEEYKTYSVKDTRFGYIEIFLQNKIDGETLENIFSRNGFIVDLKVLNPSIITFKEDFISVYLNILAYCEIFEIHSLIFKINFSEFEENLYTSLPSGEDLVQKTFEIKKSFENINFSRNENYIFYLEKENLKNSIKKVSLETDEILNIYESNYLKFYEIFDEKHLLLIKENINQNNLILLNIENFKEDIFFSFSDLKIKSLKIAKNLIAINCLKDNVSFLNLLNKDGNLTLKIKGSFSYFSISPCETFLLLLEENNLKILFLNSKEAYPLNKNLNDGKIISFKFLNSKEVLLHFRTYNKDLLIILKLSNSKKEILLETNYKILDFSIDYNKNIIYYVLKNYDKNTCEVFTIDEKKEIKNILNLNAKSMFLIVRP